MLNFILYKRMKIMECIKILSKAKSKGKVYKAFYAINVYINFCKIKCDATLACIFDN